MRAALRDPRVRVLFAAAIVLLTLALFLHLVAMVHGMAMIAGPCIAVLAAAVMLVLPGRPVVALGAIASLEGPDTAVAARIEPVGRHPPEEGVRLLH